MKHRARWNEFCATMQQVLRNNPDGWEAAIKYGWENAIEKFFNEDAAKISPAGKTITVCCDDACRRMEIPQHSIRVYSWPQTWANTSCGFGGISGQAITTAQTIIVIAPDERVCVYHGGGSFAYMVQKPSNFFWRNVGEFKLPGKIESKQHLEAEKVNGSVSEVSDDSKNT